MSARAEWYGAPMLYALVVALLYAPIWSGEQGFGWDTIETYWGDLAYLSEQLRRLEWPLWNPYDRGGYPFHADPQPGIYYPIHWLFALFGTVTGGITWWHIQLKMLLHHVIAGGAMHLYLRSRGLPVSAAVVGGVALIVCAPMMVHKASNILMPLAWVPLIWIAIDKLVEHPSWRRGLLLAGALYLAGSTGSPPGFFYTLLVCGAYGIYRASVSVALAWRGGRSQILDHARTLGLALAAAAAVTVALHLIIVIPGLELTEHSPRAQRGLAYALMGSMAGDRALIGLVHPYLGDSQIYFGVAAFALVLCALFAAPLRDRGAPLFFLAASALFFALSLGGNTPLLAFLVERVPGFDLFRIANRYKLPMMFPYAALAAYGAAALLDPQSPRLRRLLSAAAAGIAVTLLVVWLGASIDAGERGLPKPAWQAIAIAGAAGALALAAAVLRGKAAAALVLAIALLVHFDVPHFRSAYGPIMEPRPVRDYEGVLEGLEGVGDRWRVYDEYVLAQRAGSRIGMREVRSYPSGDPLDLERYRDLRAYAKNDPRILSDYNIRYILHGRHHRNGFREHDVRTRPDRLAPDAFRSLGGSRYEAKNPASLVAWYGRVVFEEDAKGVLERVAQARAGGERAYTVVEPADIPAAERERVEALMQEAGASATGELVDYRTNRIRVRIDAPAPGIVVLNEIAYPGWQVRVDGERAQPIRVNYLLRGVFVDAGSYEIEWRYRPVRYPLWLFLWLAGLGAVCFAIATWRRAPRHEL
jgi:hypothetical protein